MSPEEQVEQAALAFSRARSIAHLHALIDHWAPQFHQALRQAITQGPRPALGMEIARMPGRGGLTARRDGGFFVGIGVDGPRARRFTLAHEFAHVLLNRSQEQRSLVLNEDEEESLCEFFARRALAPPWLVHKYLNRSGTPKKISDIEEFARHFKISLRASLVVLQELLPERSPVGFIAVTWRGHAKRPAVMGMRIDTAAAARRIFLPSDVRLSSLGLRNLEASITSSEIGSRLSGSDDAVVLGSRQAGVAAWASTDVKWAAKVQRAPGSRGERDQRGAICRVDISQLIAATRPQRPRLPKPRPRPRSKSSVVSEIPGQTRLAELAP
jgi:hypothetical protein